MRDLLNTLIAFGATWLIVIGAVALSPLLLIWNICLTLETWGNALFRLSDFDLDPFEVPPIHQTPFYCRYQAINNLFDQPHCISQCRDCETASKGTPLGAGGIGIKKGGTE